MSTFFHPQKDRKPNESTRRPKHTSALSPAKGRTTRLIFYQWRSMHTITRKASTAAETLNPRRSEVLRLVSHAYSHSIVSAIEEARRALDTPVNEWCRKPTRKEKTPPL